MKICGLPARLTLGFLILTGCGANPAPAGTGGSSSGGSSSGGSSSGGSSSGGSSSGGFSGASIGGAGASAGVSGAGGHAGTSAGAGSGGTAGAGEPEPLDIEGNWLYLGPSDGPHTLKIARTSIDYADVSGSWVSKWAITARDNGLRHYQMQFVSGSGTYLPTGQLMSAAYDVSGTLLTVVLANGSTYPQLQGAGSCTAAADGSPVPGCSLYVKQ